MNEQALEKLRRISKYKQNWNGHGAPRISRKVIKLCKKVIPKLHFEVRIYPLASNGVQFEFKHEGKFLIIEVYDDSINIYNPKSGVDFTLDTSVINVIETINVHARMFFDPPSFDYSSFLSIGDFKPKKKPFKLCWRYAVQQRRKGSKDSFLSLFFFRRNGGL